MRRHSDLHQSTAISAVLLVLLLVVCYACNTANPMRTGSWIPFLD